MENYSTLIIPLILDAIGLVIYFCLMADWKKKIRPSTYTMCLLFFVMILAAPMVWFSTLFLMDKTPLHNPQTNDNKAIGKPLGH